MLWYELPNYKFFWEQVATCYMGDLLQSEAQIYQPYFSNCCWAFRFLGWVMVSPHLAPNDKFSIVRASPAAMVKWHVASSFQWAKFQSGVKMGLLLQTCTLGTKASKIGLVLIIDWLATVLKRFLGVCLQYLVFILGVALRVKNNNLFYKNGM
jgi:hypothetical protein